MAYTTANPGSGTIATAGSDYVAKSGSLTFAAGVTTQTITIVINGDTVGTEALLLTVNSVAVDTTGAIKDIKEIYEVPWGWVDWVRANATG